MAHLMQLAAGMQVAAGTAGAASARGSGLPGYPQSDILTQGHLLWLAARGRAEMPGRAAIDPALLAPLRPLSLLFAVERAPLDFRYVEIGSRMVALSNDDYTGKRLSEIAHQRPPSTVWDHLTAAVDARAPIRGVLPYVGRSRDIHTIFHIVLPLADDGETVDHLLVCADLAPRVRLQDGTHPFTQLG